MAVSRRERQLLALNMRGGCPQRVNDRIFANIVCKITRAKQNDVRKLEVWFNAVYPSIARRLTCDAATVVACVLLDTLQIFCDQKHMHTMLTPVLSVFKRIFTIYSRSTPHLHIRMMRILFSISCSRSRCCAQKLGETALHTCEKHAGGGLTIAFLAHMVTQELSSFNNVMRKRLVGMCADHVQSEERSVKFMSSLRILSCIAVHEAELLIESGVLMNLTRAIEATPMKFMHRKVMKELAPIVTALLPHAETSNTVDDTCAICLDNVVDPRHMHCGHFFCVKCIRRHLCASLAAPQCPMCRRLLDGHDVMRVARL